MNNKNEKFYEFICSGCQHNFVNESHKNNCPKCGKPNQTIRKIK